MERQILFRGKTKEGKWVYGDYVRGIGLSKEEIVYIVPREGGLWVEVLPETVSQYIGAVDEAGVKVFEGDEVDYDYFDNWTGEKIRTHAIVEFKGGEFFPYPSNTHPNYKVTGNIHDNPELIIQ